MCANASVGPPGRPDVDRSWGKSDRRRADLSAGSGGQQLSGACLARAGRVGTRLRRTAVWDIVQLAANGSIFVLLGEQIPALLAAAPRTVLATGHENAWWLAFYVGVIVVVLGSLRFGWVWNRCRWRSSARVVAAPRRPRQAGASYLSLRSRGCAVR